MREPKPSCKTYPAPNWRKILLIRHGATALNSTDRTVDRIRGWTDYPLSEQGRLEAVMLADKIAPHPPAVLLHSDLNRATQTAEIIVQAIGVPWVRTGMEFRPWDVGLFVGSPSKTAVPALARYATQTPYKVVPGGEAFDTFRVRLFKGLLNALRCNEGLVGIVTHHRCERLLKAWAKAEYPEDGSFDEEEFTKKGEPTGHCEIIKVPQHRLELWQKFQTLQRPHRFHDSDLARVTLEHKL